MNARHAAVPSYARLPAPIPTRCGDALRVDPLGRVHYDGGSSESSSSESDTEVEQKKRQARIVSVTSASGQHSATAGANVPACGTGSDTENTGTRRDGSSPPTLPSEAPIHGLRLSFTPVPFLRPKALSEGVRYSPQPVANATAVAFFDEAKLVLFGGEENVKAVNDTWIYDVPTKKYFFIDPLAVVSTELQTLRNNRGFTGEKVPAPRCGHCAVAIRHVKEASRLKKSKFGVEGDRTTPRLMNGSFKTSSPPSSFSPILKSGVESSFNLSGSIRTAVATPQPASFRYEPSMLVFGGADVSRGTYYNDLWLFDVEAAAWRELRPHGKIPPARWLHSGVALEMRLFVYGGESSNFQILDDLHMYDHMVGGWRAIRVLDPRPPARMLHSATVVQHKMFVIGGVGVKSTNGCILKTEDTQKKSELSDVWQLDMRGLVWRQIAVDSKMSSPFLVRSDVGQTQEAGQCECPSLPIPDPRLPKVFKSLEGHSALPFDHRILVFGGRLNGKYNRRIFSLDTSTEQWTYLGDTPAGQGDGKTPQARSGASSCIMTEFSSVNNLSNAITLQELERSNVSLSDDAVMQPFLHAAAKQLSRQIAFSGVLSVYDCKPLVSHSVCAFIYGGYGYPRNFSDLWRVELRDTWKKDSYEQIFGSRMNHLLRAPRTHTKDGRPIKRPGNKLPLEAALQATSAENDDRHDDDDDDDDDANDGGSSSCSSEDRDDVNEDFPFSSPNGAGGKKPTGKKSSVETFVFGSPLPAVRRRSSAASTSSSAGIGGKAPAR